MDDVAQKRFSFSFSRLKSFEVCPRRYYETNVLRRWGEETSEHLTYGDDVHKAMAAALKTGTELPAKFVSFQPWLDKVNRTPGELLVEGDCRWALTADLKPTAWYSDKAWMRSIADAVKLSTDVALVVDWKSGKSLNGDPVQLTMMSLSAFAHFPRLQCIRSDFIWLQEDAQTTQVVHRHQIADKWAEILPRVKRLEQATIDENFPPTPNRFCRRYCAVRSCEFWGK